MFILLTDAKSGGLKCYQYSHYNEDGLHFIYLLQISTTTKQLFNYYLKILRLDPKLQSPANFST